MLVSCSSSDVEFNSLLRHHQETLTGLQPGIFDDLEVRLNGRLELFVAGGGVPINFRRERDTIRFADIQLTGSLILGGIQQALAILPERKEVEIAPAMPRSLMLDPEWQRRVVRTWFHVNPEALERYDAQLVEAFESTSWIAQKSGGKIFTPAASGIQSGELSSGRTARSSGYRPSIAFGSVRGTPYYQKREQLVI